MKFAAFSLSLLSVLGSTAAWGESNVVMCALNNDAYEVTSETTGEVTNEITCERENCDSIGDFGAFRGFGEEVAWCIDADDGISTGTFKFDEYSSYSPNVPFDKIQGPGKDDLQIGLPKVNWLLNFYATVDISSCGAGITWKEFQQSIWNLADEGATLASVTGYNACIVDALTDAANANGDFDPCMSDLETPLVGVILIVDSANGSINKQALIVARPAECNVCDDMNPCTMDMCDRDGNCIFEPIENCCVEDDDCKWCKCLKKDSDAETGICKPDPCMWGEWNNDNGECDCMGSQQCWDGFCKKGWAYDKFLGSIQICDTPKLPADGTLIEGFGLCCLCADEEAPCDDRTDESCINYDPNYVPEPEAPAYDPVCDSCMPGQCALDHGGYYGVQCFPSFPDGSCYTSTVKC